MVNKQTIYCPVSEDRVDNNVTRIIALMVLLIAITGSVLNNYWVFVYLAFDFAVRAFFKGKGSLLKWIGQQIVKLLKIVPKPINAAPRKFAAALGFVFSVLIALLIFNGSITASYIFNGMLAVCAFMESFLGFCIGCYLYTFFIIPFIKNPA